MDKAKQWIALTAVGVVAILAAGWFLLISPKHADADALNQQADAQRSTNAQLTSKLAMLKQQAKDLPRQQARLAAVAAKIPDNPALPSLIRALTDAADSAGVELVSLSPTKPAAVTAPAAPAAATTATAPVATSANGTARPAAAAAAGSSAGVLQSIGVNLSVVGGYFQVEQFLDRVENLTRAMKVTAFSLAPGSNPVAPAVVTAEGQAAPDPGKVLNASITASVYMSTGRTAAAAGK